MSDAILRKRIGLLLKSYKKMGMIPPVYEMILDEIIQEVDAYIEHRYTPHKKGK